jgi:hypothetical protein
LKSFLNSNQSLGRNYDIGRKKGVNHRFIGQYAGIYFCRNGKIDGIFQHQKLGQKGHLHFYV